VEDTGHQAEIPLLAVRLVVLAVVLGLLVHQWILAHLEQQTKDIKEAIPHQHLGPMAQVVVVAQVRPGLTEHQLPGETGETELNPTLRAAPLLEVAVAVAVSSMDLLELVEMAVVEMPM
jgi:hypothetical protein